MAKDFISLKRKIIQQFTNTSQSLARRGVLYDEYDEPTYLGFWLDFDFISPDNPITGGNYDDFPHGLLGSVSAPYSAENYLRSMNENKRADSIKVFKQILRDISKETPYFIQKIEGIDSLYNIDPTKNWRAKDAAITLTFLEALDNRMTALFDSYRKAAFDTKYMRWALPDIHRYFKVNLYITEFRTFHVPYIGERTTERAQFNIGLPNFPPIPPLIKNFLKPLDKNFSILKYELSHCEIIIPELKQSWAGLDNTSAGEAVSGTMKIKVGKINEVNEYSILADTLFTETENLRNGILSSEEFSGGKRQSKTPLDQYQLYLGDNSTLTNLISAIVKGTKDNGGAILGNAYNSILDVIGKAFAPNAVEEILQNVFDNLPDPSSLIKDNPSSAGLDGAESNLSVPGNVGLTEIIKPDGNPGNIGFLADPTSGEINTNVELTGSGANINGEGSNVELTGNKTPTNNPQSVDLTGINANINGEGSNVELIGTPQESKNLSSAELTGPDNNINGPGSNVDLTGDKITNSNANAVDLTGPDITKNSDTINVGLTDSGNSLDGSTGNVELASNRVADSDLGNIGLSSNEVSESDLGNVGLSSNAIENTDVGNVGLTGNNKNTGNTNNVGLSSSQNSIEGNAGSVGLSGNNKKAGNTKNVGLGGNQNSIDGSAGNIGLTGDFLLQEALGNINLDSKKPKSDSLGNIGLTTKSQEKSSMGNIGLNTKVPEKEKPTAIKFEDNINTNKLTKNIGLTGADLNAFEDAGRKIQTSKGDQTKPNPNQ